MSYPRESTVLIDPSGFLTFGCWKRLTLPGSIRPSGVAAAASASERDCGTSLHHRIAFTDRLLTDRVLAQVLLLRDVTNLGHRDTHPSAWLRIRRGGAGWRR